jgi:hypothetical protein
MRADVIRGGAPPAALRVVNEVKVYLGRILTYVHYVRESALGHKTRNLNLFNPHIWAILTNKTQMWGGGKFRQRDF